MEVKEFLKERPSINLKSLVKEAGLTDNHYVQLNRYINGGVEKTPPCLPTIKRVLEKYGYKQSADKTGEYKRLLVRIASSNKEWEDEIIKTL